MDELAGITYVLTISQPWAAIMIEGPRRFHNVTARPSSRIVGQRVAVYAAPKPDTESGWQAMQLLGEQGIGVAKRATWKTRRVTGAVIGTATVTGITTKDEDPWFVGPYALVLDERTPMKAPRVMAQPRQLQAGGIWRIAQ